MSWARASVWWVFLAALTFLAGQMISGEVVLRALDKIIAAGGIE